MCVSVRSLSPARHSSSPSCCCVSSFPSPHNSLPTVPNERAALRNDLELESTPDDTEYQRYLRRAVRKHMRDMRDAEGQPSSTSDGGHHRGEGRRPNDEGMFGAGHRSLRDFRREAGLEDRPAVLKMQDLHRRPRGSRAERMSLRRREEEETLPDTGERRRRRTSRSRPPRRQPLDPSKYTLYDLSDVGEHSNADNRAAFAQFMQQQQQQRERETAGGPGSDPNFRIQDFTPKFSKRSSNGSSGQRREDEHTSPHHRTASRSSSPPPATATIPGAGTSENHHPGSFGATRVLPEARIGAKPSSSNLGHRRPKLESTRMEMDTSDDGGGGISSTPHRTTVAVSLNHLQDEEDLLSSTPSSPPQQRHPGSGGSGTIAFKKKKKKKQKRGSGMQ